MVITWEYDPLFVVVSDDNQSLRGYYPHRAHLACAGLSYIILCTSKPVSRLIKVSRNPLSADEILSITVFISTRCSSEVAARPTNSLRTSDRTLDGAGLFLSALFGSRTLGASGVNGIIFWPHRTRRGPSRRHFAVARFRSGGVRRRRFALHHLWKKIP